MVSGGQSRPREDRLQDVIVSRAVGYKTMYGTAQRADVGVAPGHTAGLQWQNTAKETGRAKRDRAEPPGEISPWTLVCSDSWAEPRCTSSSSAPDDSSQECKLKLLFLVVALQEFNILCRL